MEEKPTYTEIPIEFIDRQREVESAYRYTFRPLGPLVYAAGDYCHIRVSGMPDGVRAVREFSFASAPHESSIEFGVHIRPESEYQKRLELLQQGDTVSLFKIKRHMTWPPTSAEAVMIAGGIGITPFSSMLKDAVHTKLTLHSTVLHVASAGYPYGSLVEKVASEYLQETRESMHTALEKLIQHRPQAQYYVAGSPKFTESVLTLLSGQGIVPQTDSFKGLDAV